MNNPFVSYLNILHSSDANNRGALAEAQAKEPFFAQIQVSHPWAGDISDTLVKSNGNSVILSGHAGDGKSTIAIEVLRKLKGLPPSATLQSGLQKKESIEFNGIRVTVVKDLSECTESVRDEIFTNIQLGSRYLLISNTGTLLDFFLKRIDRIGRSAIEIENDILSALDSQDCASLNAGMLFTVYNLAQYDNVDLAISFLRKVVDSSEWRKCDGCECRSVCPVLLNRTLVAKYYDIVLDRIRLLYFRAYAYGERLTMRQISAHFSYMITSGLDCTRIHELHMMHNLGDYGYYLFTNRFWGDNGKELDSGANQMKAIRVFNDQHLNSRYSPGVERVFWDVASTPAILDRVPELQGYVERTLKMAKRTTKPNDAAYARRAWRRLVYFFYANLSPGEKFDNFVSAFLDSPMIQKFKQWQDNCTSFKAKSLQPALTAVLQEEFCGVMPIDGSALVKELYVTLRRKSPDIKQSAQLVLHHFNFAENFKIQMSDSEPPEPELVGVGALSGIRLTLTLPFLDYIVSRKSGLIGRGLSLSYRDRLEKLMAQIVYKLPKRTTDGLLVLKQLEDGKLSTISVSVTDDGMEVYND